MIIAKIVTIKTFKQIFLKNHIKDRCIFLRKMINLIKRQQTDIKIATNIVYWGVPPSFKQRYDNGKFISNIPPTAI